MGKINLIMFHILTASFRGCYELVSKSEFIDASSIYYLLWNCIPGQIEMLKLAIKLSDMNLFLIFINLYISPSQSGVSLMILIKHVWTGQQKVPVGVILGSQLHHQGDDTHFIRLQQKLAPSWDTEPDLYCKAKKSRQPTIAVIILNFEQCDFVMHYNANGMAV